jgi:threonine aldolase
MMAGKVGMEAGLLVPSGTMSNVVSVLTHCSRGEEVILGDISHIFLSEVGGISALGGVFPHIVPNQPDGKILLERIESIIRADNIHFPKTRLICLENTQNRCSGAVLTPEYTAGVISLAKRHDLSVHLDGARIFNAAVALGVDVRELTRGVDSVSVCLSKGLSAPVGSILCSCASFIARARKMRKMLGGAMRQAGVLAAAGIVALEEMVGRLAQDHANARRLADGISRIEGLTIDIARIRTNIVIFDLADQRITEKEFVARLREREILLHHAGPCRFRIVTHYGISEADIDQTLTALETVMRR